MLPGAEIHGCRWAWCRQFFSSSAALAGHVISVHLTAAQPVSRADIPMLRRVEEGYSQSFEILSRADFEAVKSSASSLPSPPPSTPTSLPSAVFPSPTQQPRTPPVDPALHTPQKNEEPSFASLSSPAESHLFSPCIPESPSLSRMISDAVRAGERPNDISPSKSSSSSRASVEQQLTPSLGDVELSSQSFPSQPSARQHTVSVLFLYEAVILMMQVTIPGPRKPPLPFNNRGQRQAWYQTRPKQRKRPTTLSVVVSPENSHPQSPAKSSNKRKLRDLDFEVIRQNLKSLDSIFETDPVFGSNPDSDHHQSQPTKSADCSTLEPSQTGGPVESQFPYQTQASYDSQL